MEFAYDEVAKIVAQTMNNYLMFNKLLKCKLMLLLPTSMNSLQPNRACILSGSTLTINIFSG